MPRAAHAGASVLLALAVCGVSWGIPEAAQLSQMWPCCILILPGHMLGAGRGVGTWQSELVLPNVVHTHTHTLTHAALALLPAMQLDFAPGNSSGLLSHICQEKLKELQERRRILKEKKEAVAAPAWLWLSLGVTQLPGWTPGVETARSWGNQCVHGSAGLQELLHSPSTAQRCRVQG